MSMLRLIFIIYIMLFHPCLAMTLHQLSNMPLIWDVDVHAVDIACLVVLMKGLRCFFAFVIDIVVVIVFIVVVTIRH
jgi:hypothetical protein